MTWKNKNKNLKIPNSKRNSARLLRPVNSNPFFKNLDKKSYLEPRRATRNTIRPFLISEALGRTLELIVDQKGRPERLEADNRALQAKVESTTKSKKKRMRPATTKQMINQLQTVRKRLDILDKRLSQK